MNQRNVHYYYYYNYYMREERPGTTRFVGVMEFCLLSEINVPAVR